MKTYKMKVKKITPDGLGKRYLQFDFDSLDAAIFALENSKEIVDFIDSVLVLPGYSVDVSIVNTKSVLL